MGTPGQAFDCWVPRMPTADWGSGWQTWRGAGKRVASDGSKGFATAVLDSCALCLLRAAVVVAASCHPRAMSTAAAISWTG
jgi:hypothetical protein